MAVSCSKGVEARKVSARNKKKQSLWEILSPLPWDVLPLVNIFIRTIRNIYLQKRWGGETRSYPVVRQFGWMSAINSERFVERESIISDRERNWMKLPTKWSSVNSNYLVSIFPSFPKIFYLSRYHEFLQILNVCYPLLLKKAYLHNDRLDQLFVITIELFRTRIPLN